jgi:hypothetical protein
MLLCMLLIFTSAHAKMRAAHFEIFWYTHHLFVIFMLALLIHATGCFVRDTPNPISPLDRRQFWQHCLGYEAWRWEIWGFLLYICERGYREIRSRRFTRVVNMIKHPSGKTSCLKWENIRLIKLDRCDRNPVSEAFLQVHTWPMALPEHTAYIQIPMAPFYHYLLPLRQFYLRTCPPGWQLHPGGSGPETSDPNSSRWPVWSPGPGRL